MIAFLPPDPFRLPWRLWDDERKAYLDAGEEPPKHI